MSDDIREKLLEGLNPEQVQVVEHDKGPLLVAAVAGSGKSTAVTRRVAYLIKIRGVRPDRIFCTTFSKKGAGVMTERVRALVPDSDVQIQTFHAFCRRVLSTEMPGFSRWSDPDGADGRYRTFVKKAVGYEYMEWRGADVQNICSYIELAKANGYHPNTPEALDLANRVTQFSGDKFAEAYEIAEILRTNEMVMTFSDWLVAARDALRADPFARERWADKFDYVMVDEMQDNSRVQAELVEMLARDHRNIVAVGDAAQSLFAFRGAAPKLFTQFSGDWSAPIVSMSRNYRSGTEVIEIANDALESMTPESRCGDLMRAERGTNANVTLFSAETFDDEAARVANDVLALHRDGVAWRDVAVLYRTNARSRAVEEAFTHEKIPYRVVGAQFFYARKEIAALVSYLRVATKKGATMEDVKKTAYSPNRFLGKRFMEEFERAARSKTGTVEELALHAIDGLSKSNRGQQDSARDWGRLIDRLRKEVSESVPPHELLDRVIRSTGYLAWLRKDEGSESPENDRAANVGEFLRRAWSFKSAAELLDHIKSQEASFKSGKEAERENADAVTLSSIHSAKGLEWPHVFLVACNQDILPHIFSTDPDEERRIFYVAVTRARDALTISYANTSNGRRLLPSNFITRYIGEHEDPGILDEPESNGPVAKVLPFRRAQ